ncbi:MAG: hypothetical protein ABF479_10985 [Gluconacetobacter sp.]|nr:hypothetical protein [Gluconacetobacter dulcium]
MPIENNLDICHAAFTHPHMQWFRAQAAGSSRPGKTWRPIRED